LQSDYDAHHTLVEGLERFNGETAQATPERLQVLMALELAGLPLQARIVEQYVRNQASFKLVKQALWRESKMFWSQMAAAYLDLLKQACKEPTKQALYPWIMQITVRTLRYAGLSMRWDYHQTQPPKDLAWRRLHKIYRMVEQSGCAQAPLMLNGVQTSCAREYSLILLLGLLHPLGYRAHEIEKIALLFEEFKNLPLPQADLDRAAHTHVVDLSLSERLFPLDGQWVPGKRLRYLALRPLVDHLKSQDSGPEGGASSLRCQLAGMIERAGVGRERPRTYRFGRVWVASGMDNIFAALASPESVQARPALEPWTLRDESAEGMGFKLADGQVPPHGRLVAVSWNPAEGVWQLLAIRWNQEADGQCTVGAQRLSRHSKPVQVFQKDSAGEDIEPGIQALFLPMSNTEQGLSNLLLPQSIYRPGAIMSLREGELIYRLRLGKVVESHEDWVRVGMDVLGRERSAQAA
jgi:hypothetical protein